MSVCERCLAPTYGRAYTLCVACRTKQGEEIRAQLIKNRADKIKWLRESEWGVEVKVRGQVTYVDEKKSRVFVKTEYGTLNCDINDVRVNAPPAWG